MINSEEKSQTKKVKGKTVNNNFEENQEKLEENTRNKEAKNIIRNSKKRKNKIKKFKRMYGKAIPQWKKINLEKWKNIPIKQGQNLVMLNKRK